MKISLNWLSDLIDVPVGVKELCDRLDLTGTGVEDVQKSGAEFNNVVTGKIVSKTHHPDSDHMWVTLVDVGSFHKDESGNPEPLQIVCGAQNFNEGDHVVVAMIGAVLPGDFKIKKSKLRGVVSMGMNCSSKELGLGEEYDGIMILPQDAPIGMEFAKYCKISDTVLDLEITPNRPDCMSVVGLAREIGAMYDVDFTRPEMLPAAVSSQKVSDLVSVHIADAARCSRYNAQVIQGVKIAPSPKWLADRVVASGARSVNNVVDATNYIMFLFGQPLHAFDMDKLAKQGSKVSISIKPALDAEKFTTLDEVERTLSSDATVIFDENAQKSVALAGVMGGMNSEVSGDTVNILLETACFDPAHTSRTSRNLNLVSESSIRYERSVDAAQIAEIANFAAALIAQVGGGEVCASPVDVYPAPIKNISLDFRVQRFCDFIGVHIDVAKIESILTRLGIICETSTSANASQIIKCQVPTFRPDLTREIDLYEEVIRLYGMDLVPSTLPTGTGRVGVKSDAEIIKSKIHSTMNACGVNEAVNYSFAPDDDLENLQMNSFGEDSFVTLINPLNCDHSVLRQSLIPSLLRSVAYNNNHGVKNVALYEMGNVFKAGKPSCALKDAEVDEDGASKTSQPAQATLSSQTSQPNKTTSKVKEIEKIACVLSGSLQDVAWNRPARQLDFYDIKGVVENLVHALAIPKLRVMSPKNAQDYAFLSPGRCAVIMSGGIELGWIGEIHPLSLNAFDVQNPVVAFSLDVSALIKSSAQYRKFQEVPVFPAISMDIAVVVACDITHERLEQSIKNAGGKMLESVSLFDVFKSEEKLGPGLKSMAYSLTYRNAERTLTSEEVASVHAKIISRLENSCNAQVRS